MTIHITPDLVESIYNMLRLTRPFNRWKLPDPDDVGIHIRSSKLCGEWWKHKGRHIVMVSSRRHETLDTMIKTVAHEMCHIYTHTERAKHGKAYQKAAALVCKYHKWDRGAF